MSARNKIFRVPNLDKRSYPKTEAFSGYTVLNEAYPTPVLPEIPEDSLPEILRTIPCFINHRPHSMGFSDSGNGPWGDFYYSTELSFVHFYPLGGSYIIWDSDNDRQITYSTFLDLWFNRNAVPQEVAPAFPVNEINEPILNVQDVVLNTLLDHKFWLAGRNQINSFDIDVYRGTKFISQTFPITAWVDLNPYTRVIWSHGTLGRGVVVDNNNGIMSFIADSGEREDFVSEAWEVDNIWVEIEEL